MAWKGSGQMDSMGGSVSAMQRRPPMPDYLFNSGHLHQFLAGKLSEIRNEVMGLERDYLLNAR